MNKLEKKKLDDSEELIFSSFFCIPPNTLLCLYLFTLYSPVVFISYGSYCEYYKFDRRMDKKDYLVCLSPTYGSLALDELDSLLLQEGITNPRDIYPRLSNGKINFRLDQNIHMDPFVVLHGLSKEIALRIYYQAVMIRHMWELWCSSSSFHGCLHALYHISTEYKEKYFKRPDSKWRMDIHSFGLQVRNRDHEYMRKHFGSFYSMAGKVTLIDPEICYSFIVDHQPPHALHYIENPNTVQGSVNPDTIVYAPPVPDLQKFTIYQNIPHTSTTNDGGTSIPPPPLSSSLSSSSTSSVSSSCTCDFHINTELCKFTNHLCNPHLSEHADPSVASTTSTSTDKTTTTTLYYLNLHQPIFRRVFFGLSLPSESGRKYITPLRLSIRPYLGPTSLDPELALLMSNLGHARRGRIVWDPFAGTGSITVAAAKLGAMTIGSDIDPRVQYGKLGRNVVTNFTYYGLGFPEQIRMDNSKIPIRPSTHGLIDSIITDPPYGVRAGARKLGKSEKRRGWIDDDGGKDAPPSLENNNNNHDNGTLSENEVNSSTNPISSSTSSAVVNSSTYQYGTFITQVYDADDVMTDLLDVAAQVLVMNGRLVFLFPATTEDIDPINMIPHHPCLRVVHIGAQGLSFALIRLIVTLEKCKPYDVSKTEEYKQAVRASAEANGLSGGGVRARMGALLDAWFAEQQQQKSGGGKSQTKESSSPSTTDNTEVSIKRTSNATPSTDAEENTATIGTFPNAPKLSKREVRLMGKRLHRQEKRQARIEAREDPQQQQQNINKDTEPKPDYSLLLSKRELKLLENARRIEAMQQQQQQQSSSSSVISIHPPSTSNVYGSGSVTTTNDSFVRISSVPFDAPPWIIKKIEEKLQRIQQHQHQQQQQQDGSTNAEM